MHINVPYACLHATLQLGLVSTKRSTANTQVCASVCARVHVCMSAALRMGGVVGGAKGEN